MNSKWDEYEERSLQLENEREAFELEKVQLNELNANKGSPSKNEY